MKAQNVLQTIGNTPHIRINKLFGAHANVWIKSERSNPGGSVKDRIALAMVAAVKGYKLVLVMPDSMSIERRRLTVSYTHLTLPTNREV